MTEKKKPAAKPAAKAAKPVQPKVLDVHSPEGDKCITSLQEVLYNNGVSSGVVASFGHAVSGGAQLGYTDFQRLDQAMDKLKPTAEVNGQCLATGKDALHKSNILPPGKKPTM